MACAVSDMIYGVLTLIYSRMNIIIATTYNVLFRYFAFVSMCYSLLPIMLKIFDVICQLADDFYKTVYFSKF